MCICIPPYNVRILGLGPPLPRPPMLFPCFIFAVGRNVPLATPPLQHGLGRLVPLVRSNIHGRYAHRNFICFGTNPNVMVANDLARKYKREYQMSYRRTQVVRYPSRLMHIKLGTTKVDRTKSFQLQVSPIRTRMNYRSVTGPPKKCTDRSLETV